MKKRIVSMLLCGLLVISTGCSSGISQEDYDALQSEKAVLESEKSILESEKNEANQQIDSITKEFNTYKKNETV